MKRFALLRFGFVAACAALITSASFIAPHSGGGTASVVMAQDGVDRVAKSMESELDRIGERIKKRPDRTWIYAYEIQELARANEKDKGRLNELINAKFLESESELLRLVGAQVQLASGSEDTTGAMEVLQGLLDESEESLVVGSVATMLTTFEILEEERITSITKSVLERAEDCSELEASAQIALHEARSYFAPTQGDATASIEALRELLTTKDHDTEARAALALARIGKADEVLARLNSLSRESGELALTARTMLHTRSTMKRAMAPKAEDRESLFQEVIRSVHEKVDADHFEFDQKNWPLTAENLVDNAARGMCAYLDPFSQYMSLEEWKELADRSANRYAGIGAYVEKREGDTAVRITQPIYSGPAYAAGLRSGDYVWACQIADGDRIELEGKELEEIIGLLKGEEGTKLKIWVKRPGVKELVELTLTRQTVQTDPALETILPRGIGYLKLTQFGDENTTHAMRESVKALLNQGMKAMILDLRGNPGGQLTTVIDIASMFMPRFTPVTLAKGRTPPYQGEGLVLVTGQQSRRGQRYIAPFEGMLDMPLVVLINDDSASGSELLSGTLQDNKRATIMGETSYGKGIGQGFAPVRTDSMEKEFSMENGRILKCTTFAYYIMPSKRNIDRYLGEGGVKPDIPVVSQVPSTWEWEHISALRRSEALDTWVRERWEENKKLFMELADFDGYSEARYPDFDALYTSLNTPLSRKTVRLELRSVLRTRAADERAAQFVNDYQIDQQLQAAIVEVAKQAKISLFEEEHYAGFVK